MNSKNNNWWKKYFDEEDFIDYCKKLGLDPENDYIDELIDNYGYAERLSLLVPKEKYEDILEYPLDLIKWEDGSVYPIFYAGGRAYPYIFESDLIYEYPQLKNEYDLTENIGNDIDESYNSVNRSNQVDIGDEIKILVTGRTGRILNIKGDIAKVDIYPEGNLPGRVDYFYLDEFEEAEQLRSDDVDESYHSVKGSNPLVEARSIHWKTVRNRLERDLEDYDDPLYNGTDTGELITEMMVQVEDKLGVWLEPSIQGGQGGIWVYSIKDDSEVASGIDYYEFHQTVIELALMSNSITEFKSEYKSYLEEQIDSHRGGEDDIDDYDIDKSDYSVKRSNQFDIGDEVTIPFASRTGRILYISDNGVAKVDIYPKGNLLGGTRNFLLQELEEIASNKENLNKERSNQFAAGDEVTISFIDITGRILDIDDDVAEVDIYPKGNLTGGTHYFLLQELEENSNIKENLNKKIEHKKINIKESLKTIDRDSYNKYGLLTLYEAYSDKFNMDDKKTLAKMLYNNCTNKTLYNYLMEKGNN